MLGLCLFAQVGDYLPRGLVLAQVALHPGIGQPLLGLQILAVAAVTPVPLLQPE
ncbi:hypothetical protein D3C78_1901300 [compost metagenome]